MRKYVGLTPTNGETSDWTLGKRQPMEVTQNINEAK